MDKEATMHFPLGGIDVQAALDRQPIVKTRTGTYAYTTPIGVNVRSFDGGQDRSRGGSRPGTVKYLEDRPGNVLWVTQCLNVIVYMSADAVG